MRFTSLAIGTAPYLAGLLPTAAGVDPTTNGRTLTGWDCCKPACSWTTSARRSGASGIVKVCDKNDTPLSARAGALEQSGCNRNNPGNGFLCSDFSPQPVADEFSYAFAITDGTDHCCKCFELRWTDGPSAGKRVQVQVINEGGAVNATVGREFVILTPGGGVGPNTAGCFNEFGYDWGRQYGGVEKREDCEALPDALQGGCYWRWNWARGDINGWNMTYTSISCPDSLSSISGCSA